jgi:hypothetical protein
MKVRLSGECPGSTGTAVRQKDKQRRRGPRPHIETLDPRVTPVSGLTPFAPGADGIDRGQPTQTIANSLTPCGLVYDLVQNQHIPIDGAINPKKTVFGADFTAGGKSYSGGPFLIEAPFAAAHSTVARWQQDMILVGVALPVSGACLTT